MRKLLYLLIILVFTINNILCQTDNKIISSSYNNLVYKADTTPPEFLHLVTFVIKDGTTLISGAQITFNSETLTTNSSGRVVFEDVYQGFDLPYNVSVPGYIDVPGVITVFKDEEVVIQLVVKIPTAYIVTFTIDDGNIPISGGQIIFNEQILTTDSGGKAVFSEVATGDSLLYYISANGYADLSGTINVSNQDIEVLFHMIAELPETSTGIFIPNAITPNGDGVNDYLIIDDLNENTELIIFNKLGKIVYKSSNYKNDWNGVDKYGNQLNDGVYWYSLDIPNFPNVFTGFILIK